MDETPDVDTKLSVIETLRTVTEGKVSEAFHDGRLVGKLTTLC